MPSSKKIVLFNPKTSEISRRKGVLPLALLSISAKLKEKGYKIVILDEAIDTFSEEWLDGALCFGISAMIGYQIYSALIMAKRIKKLRPKIPIVWGGWHPSIQPEQTAENENVDFLVRGQGEVTFYELVKAIEQNDGFETILGLTYKRDGKIQSNPDRPIMDPNTFPRLPYELIEMQKYIHVSEFGQRTINYLSSIGCPFNCGFCAEKLVHRRKWIPLASERVLDDLEYLINTYSVDSVVINDSEFFINEKRVAQICRGMIDRGFHIKWGNVNGRADILMRYKEGTWELMRKSGLQSILTGAETYDPTVLKLINKKYRLRTLSIFQSVPESSG
jgi:anaerobic magnesium-protoporphyrin IX monomethyl ester cyclase